MDIYHFYNCANNKKLLYTPVIIVLIIFCLFFSLSNVYAQKVSSEINLKNLYQRATTLSMNRNNEEFEKLINENPQLLDYKYERGSSLAFMVSDNIEVLRFLIGKGMKLNVKDDMGHTPLHYAVENQLNDAVEILLDNGAVVDARTEDGDTPLHIAVKYGFWKIALLLIEHGADVNAKNGKGLTPSALAEMNNKPMIVEMLKEHGAEPFQTDKHPVLAASKMEFLSFQFSSPLKDLNGILALVNLVLALYFLIKMFSEKDGEKLAKIKNGIDSMLLICLFMILFVIIDVYSIWRTDLDLIYSGNLETTPDNVSSFLTKLFFHSSLISFFLIVWLLLRTFNISKRERLSKS